MLSTYDLVLSFAVIVSALFFFNQPLLVSLWWLLCLVAFFAKRHGFLISETATNTTSEQRPKRKRSDGQATPSTSITKLGRRNQNSLLFNASNSFNFSESSMINCGFSSTPFGASLPNTSFQSPSMGFNYSLYMPNDSRHLYHRLSPHSHFGNLPIVKLSKTEADEKPVKKPVTVKIAPLHHSVISPESTFGKLASGTVETVSFGLDERPTTVADAKKVVEAIQEKRKRPKRSEEQEQDDSFNKNSSKRVKTGDSSQAPSRLMNNSLANGLVSSRIPGKRSATDYLIDSSKRYKNNEILSSYNPLTNFTRQLKTVKRKTVSQEEVSTPKVARENSKEQTSERIDETIQDVEPSTSKTRIEIAEDESTEFINDQVPVNQVKDTKEKLSFEVPLHVPTMEEHKKDEDKRKEKLRKFLDSIQRVNNTKESENKSPESVAWSSSSSLDLDQTQASNNEPSISLHSDSLSNLYSSASHFSGGQAQTSKQPEEPSIPSVALPSVSLPSVSLPSVSLSSVSPPSAVSLPPASLPSVSFPSSLTADSPNFYFNAPQFSNNPTLASSEPSLSMPSLASLQALQQTGTLFSIGAGGGNKKVGSSSRARRKR